MQSIKINLLAVTFLLFVFARCQKTTPETNNVGGFDAYIQDEIEAQDIPALSLLVFRENGILHERYFGNANLQENEPLTADHLFLLASISKTITATALLQLYGQGHFQLDDPINDYLPFQVHVPNYNRAITFRMLLAHTSAIADGPALDSQYFYGEDSPVSLDDFLENYLVPNGTFYHAAENFYNFEPGTQHEYSNEGSALIAVLVESISGMGFNEYCQANIFSPLGMTDTFWRLDEISQPIATPYDYGNNGLEPIEHYTFTDYPNGGLRSTSKDLFKFLSAIAMGGTANNFQLLKSGTVGEMLSPQIPNIDKTVGLHFFLMDKTHQLWGHDGGEQGVSTIMAFNPTDKTGAIILTNFGEADLEEMLREAYLFGKGL